MRIEQRLAALEALRPDRSGREQAAAFSDKLMTFLEDTFAVAQTGCRMDDVARCCGLPDAKAMRRAFELDLTESAFRAAAEKAYGDDWPEQMQATMDAALGQVTEVRGVDGPLDFVSVFPPALNAAAVVIGAVNQ